MLVLYGMDQTGGMCRGALRYGGNERNGESILQEWGCAAMTLTVPVQTLVIGMLSGIPQAR
ncbi:MAG: hypothetical protein HFH10_05415 [Dorea sp.]|nr:hypothetical protein [Dorea sp.]